MPEVGITILANAIDSKRMARAHGLLESARGDILKPKPLPGKNAERIERLDPHPVVARVGNHVLLMAKEEHRPLMYERVLLEERAHLVRERSPLIVFSLKAIALRSNPVDFPSSCM